MHKTWLPHNPGWLQKLINLYIIKYYCRDHTSKSVADRFDLKTINVQQPFLSHPALGSCIPDLGHFFAINNWAKMENLVKYFYGQDITPLEISHQNLSIRSLVSGGLFFLRCAYFWPCYWIWDVLTIYTSFYIVYTSFLRI